MKRVWLTVITVGLAVLLGLPPAVAGFMAHPPRRPLQESPADWGMGFLAVAFASESDGLSLAGWYIPAPGGSDRTVVMTHGFLNDRLIHGRGLPIARELHAAGFNVVLFDLRGHGQSPDVPVTFGVMEQGDVAGAVAFARQQGARWVGLLGFSLGGAASILAAAADEQIAAVVADSVYPDLHQYLTGEIERRLPLPQLAEPYFLWWFRRLTGIDERTVRPADAASRLGGRPLLVIHGTADRVIPVALSATMEEWAVRWVVEGARHTHSYERNPAAYCDRVVGFFLAQSENPLTAEGVPVFAAPAGRVAPYGCLRPPCAGYCERGT